MLVTDRPEGMWSSGGCAGGRRRSLVIDMLASHLNCSLTFGCIGYVIKMRKYPNAN